MMFNAFCSVATLTVAPGAELLMSMLVVKGSVGRRSSGLVEVDVARSGRSRHEGESIHTIRRETCAPDADMPL